MLEPTIRHKITELIKTEVVPAVGCTEPIAVALAVAKATEILGKIPSKIEVILSGNIIKNAMGVGIPGTGMVGLPIAVALGAIAGKSELYLEVLRDIDIHSINRAKEYLNEDRISILHKNDAPSNLYIEVTVSDTDGNNARSIIAYTHTNFIHLSRNGKTILEKSDDKLEEISGEANIDLDLFTVWQYATESPIEELQFILEAKKLNEAASQYALHEKQVGHQIGQLINSRLNNCFGGSVLGKMLANTSGACDARMAGEKITVMSNSGSGNQGIAITMPVVTYAKEIGANENELIRALILAHLTSIYIKQSLGRLSALCGCVVASTGASLALVYLMGGNYQIGSYAVKNMIATLTGMICDGAKPACSLKIASGVSTAYISALMAMNNQCVTHNEGIIERSVDDTIKNFSLIGREAMQETDKMVLKMMVGSVD